MYAEYSKIIKFNELADPMDHWELIEKVGEGTYGEVHMAKHKELGKLCVCVCVKKTVYYGYAKNCRSN